jgi:hypothetical protein
VEGSFLGDLEPYSGDGLGFSDEVLKKDQKVSDFPSKTIIL